MRHLLQETLSELKNHGKKTSDVWFVASAKRDWGEDDVLEVGSWNDFVALANFEYDEGFGGNEVSSRLTIVGDDWWLERGEYDGSEWWDFKTLPEKPVDAVALANLRETL